ncbi:MAG: PAS domain S-box protein [Pseudomonadota bacterium]|nr:PAS domain S-box protein [Pseudomonadota bacterium]
MKLLYVAAWMVIIGFLVWSGSLLVKIQSMGAETTELHQLGLHLDSLAIAWRDLSRPGNDVLENYEVEEQRAAFGFYKRRYDAIQAAVQQRVQGDNTLAPIITGMQPTRDTLVDFAKQIFDLSEQREALRLAQAQTELISEKETAAATAMARMDQTFQNGLDVILKAGTVVVGHEMGLEGLQREIFQRHYTMLLVTLLVSALSLELIRHSMRQREALRDGATRINTIVNNVVDGIVTVDADGAIESINQSAEQMFGYGASEVLGKKFIVLLEEDCRNTYLDQLRDGNANHVTHSFLSDECEGHGRRQDGSTFPIELAINQVMVKGRRLFVHIVRNVTERKQADQKQRLAASVFENASEGIVVTDVDGTIQSVNPAYMSITQYRAEELLGKNPKLLQSGKQDQEFYERMWASISGPGHWQGEIWNRRKNGEIFPQWVTINAIKDSRGRTTNYVGVAWDISELKASQRMKEEFIATISHELRTPLTSVLGSLGMLMGNMTEQLPEQAQRLIALAHSNSRRLVRLINDILDIEKIEAGRMTFQFEPLELKTLVYQVIEDSKALAEQAQVTISCQTLATDAWVNGDADRLMQAVSNLLSNAIKFSPPGKPVEVVVAAHGPMLRVEVTDHGPGIPKEFHNQIFKRFAQAGGVDRGWKAGTGLGLSITKLIVRQHGGRIDFQSTPGVRTTFCIDLPRAEQDSLALKPDSIHTSTEQSHVARS